MRRYAIAYVSALLVILIFDAIWLTLMGKSLYRDRLGDLLLSQPVILPAILFYLLYSAGIVILVVTRAESWSQALVLGAVLGLVAYGTYDLTNQATMRVWSSTITIVDMLWGAALSGLAATVATLAAHRWG